MSGEANPWVQVVQLSVIFLDFPQLAFSRNPSSPVRRD